MTEKTYDPTRLAAHLEQSFGAEPPHAAIEDDLRAARRRLRRHRAKVSLSGTAVAAVAASALVMVPGLLPHQAADLQAASAPLTDADVVRDCVGYNDWVASGASGDGSGADLLPRAQVRSRMGSADLMTRAVSGDVTVATVRSQDGASWLDCRLVRRADEPLKAFVNLYPTAVSFPRTTVHGVRAYEPHNEADPRLEGTATGSVPQFTVTCAVDAPEESTAAHLAESRCPTYRLTWNDRRPSEVARARVVTPDGTEVDADVRDGYLSLSYTGEMTPRMAATVARGDTPGARRVTFFDKDGNVLVDDRDPGHYPVGRPGTENFPSLAWWLKR